MNRMTTSPRLSVEKADDLLQRVLHPNGPQLADGVAEPDVALAGRVARAQPPGEPLGGLEHVGRQALGHPVAVTALGGEVRSHAAAFVLHAPVRIDQEEPDPVAQLARDRAALVGDEPARAVGGGERVVRTGEDGLVEAQLAERQRSVAGARARARGRRPTPVVASAGEDQHDCDERPNADRTRGGGDRQRPTARAPVVLACAGPAALQHHKQLAGAEEDQHRAGGDRRNLDGERRVEHHEHAEHERADAAQRAPPLGLRGGAQLPAQAGERRLHVLGIERRGRRADHQAAERKQEPAGDQRPDEGVEQPGARGLHVRVGELVLALETRQDPRAQDQEHHRQKSAHDSHRDAAAQHRDPPVRSHQDRGRKRQQRKQRQHDAEHAHIVRDGQRLPGEVAPAQRQPDRPRSPRAAPWRASGTPSAARSAPARRRLRCRTARCAARA